MSFQKAKAWYWYPVKQFISKMTKRNLQLGDTKILGTSAEDKDWGVG